MKYLLALICSMFMASSVVHAEDQDDQRPTPLNINKYSWGYHVEGSKSANAVIFIFKQDRCQHKYKMKGANDLPLKKAIVYENKGGDAGKVLGLGCWLPDADTRRSGYLGYQGAFDMKTSGKVIEFPWAEMFNASFAN